MRFVEQRGDARAVLVAAAGKCLAVIGGGFDHIDSAVPGQHVAEGIGQCQRPQANGRFQSVRAPAEKAARISGVGQIEQRAFQDEQRFVEAIGVDPRFEIVIGPAAREHALHAAVGRGGEGLPDRVKIAHAAGDGADMIEVQRQRGDAFHRQLAEAGLEAADAAEGRRADDRAAGLRAEAARHISVATAAALPLEEPPGVWLEIPGIARRRRIEAGPLGGDGLAENDRPGFSQRGRQRRRRAVATCPSRRGEPQLGRPAGNVDDVLDADGNAVQRARAFVIAQQLSSRSASRRRAGRIDEDPGFDTRFELLDPVQAVLDQIAGPQ